MTASELAIRGAEAQARKSLGDYAVGMLLVEQFLEDPIWRREAETWLEHLQRRVEERRIARVKVMLSPELDRDGRNVQ